MRSAASVLLVVLFAGGCGPSVPEGGSSVPAIDPPGRGFEVVGGDFVVDDTLGVHVVFALARAGDLSAQLQYARGRAEGDTVRWSGARVLLPETGKEPRIALADTILHVLAGDRLRHLASTDGGRLWHDLGALIPPDSSWSATFDVATRGGSVFIASVERPTLPGAGERAELRVHSWRLGNRANSRLLSSDQADVAVDRIPRIVRVDSALEARYTIDGVDVHAWRSEDDGVSWAWEDVGTAPSAAGPTETGPDILAERTVRARVYTLTKDRGVPRVFLRIRSVE